MSIASLWSHLNPRLIIAISGKQRSGKDYVATLLMNNGLSKLHFNRTALALELKKEWGSQYGLTLDEVEEIKTLPLVRTALINHSKKQKQINLNYWTDVCLSKAHNLLITDVRFLHELDRLNEAATCLTIRIEADREMRASRGILSNEDDPSEVELDDYNNWDYVISNDGDQLGLYRQVELVLDSIKQYT